MIVRTLAAQLVCALFLCLSFTCSNADLASAIVECNAAVVSEEDSGNHLISDDCPGLIVEIESGQWQEMLAPGWREELSYREFSQLEYFVSYYSQQASADGDISLSSLDEIVAGLGIDDQQVDSESLWDRIINWFSDLLSEETDYGPGWLSEWLSNIQVSTSAIEVMFWTLSALIVVAAVAVIVREVRAVRGSMPASVLRSKEFGHVGGIEVNDQLLTLKDVDNAALNDKPSVLLRLLLQQLEVLGVVAHSPARTHRDVRSAAGELGNDGVDIISRVSESAERIRFSDEKNRPQEIGEVVSVGITLLNELKPEQS